MINRRLALCLASALLVSAFAAHAQTGAAPKQIQQEFDAFITGFRAALKANDSAAVTGMTHYNYPWRDQFDAASFQKTLYPKIFTPRVRTCLAKGKAIYHRSSEGHDNMTMFCGEQLFVFVRTPGGFRFSEVGAND
jgi:hypothetical protein